MKLNMNIESMISGFKIHDILVAFQNVDIMFIQYLV